MTVDGTYVNPTTILATVVNQDAPGRIQITKKDVLDNHPIAGVQFDIYAVDAKGNAADLVATMTTNAQGFAESPDLFPADYIVREHANPTGYEDTLWSEKITVGMDELVTRTVTNMPIQGIIRIVKTDSETGNGLPGAVFTVTRISGLPSHNGKGDGEIVAVLTTDKNGVAETPLLTWGEYRIEETSVPDDYLDEGFSVTVKIPAKAAPVAENTEND
ncbi:MAG: collagen binding domain-containing protein [Aristaeellaceae bacterium]